MVATPGSCTSCPVYTSSPELTFHTGSSRFLQRQRSCNQFSIGDGISSCGTMYISLLYHCTRKPQMDSTRLPVVKALRSVRAWIVLGLRATSTTASILAGHTVATTATFNHLCAMARSQCLISVPVQVLCEGPMENTNTVKSGMNVGIPPHPTAAGRSACRWLGLAGSILSLA